MDDAGLAFYFLQKIKDANLTRSLPNWVLSRLEQSFTANRQRVDDMAQRFDSLNRQFRSAGVRYAVVKGLSIVPQFCPDAYLRHQGDFDYLVDEAWLPTAQRIVLASGYIQKPSTSNQESIFVTPGMSKASRSPQQYSACAPHAVELHLEMWESDTHRLPPIPALFSVNRTRTQQWQGLSFPSLLEDDEFLLQVLHACQHLFTYWIRMSSLFEIGYFLHRRAGDTELWKQIERRVGENAMLREFVVVITELVADLFAAPVPTLVQGWAHAIRPATRVWIENYARQCAFCIIPSHDLCVLPTSKLVLFLHQQYEDACVDEHAVRGRLMSFPRLTRMASALRAKPSLFLSRSWWKRNLVIRRSLFHLLAGFRYVCEIPRWRWLNRANLRPTSPSP